MAEFNRDDRVRIKRAEAEFFVQPFRRFAETGRTGTVRAIMGMDRTAQYRRAIVIFDTKRRGCASQSANFRFQDLEMADGP